MTNHTTYSQLKKFKIFIFCFSGDGFLNDTHCGNGYGLPYYRCWEIENYEETNIPRGCGDSFLNGDYDEEINNMINPNDIDINFNKEWDIMDNENTYNIYKKELF